jgi:hypothetical protein
MRLSRCTLCFAQATTKCSALTGMSMTAQVRTRDPVITADVVISFSCLPLETILHRETREGEDSLSSYAILTALSTHDIREMHHFETIELHFLYLKVDCYIQYFSPQQVPQQLAF